MLKTTQQKKILCIHDLSVVGRCSLAVISPVLCAMGMQAVPLPTVVLSTHTGGLGSPAVLKDETFASACLAHYAALGITFDCIYTGYLGGMAGIAIAKQAFAQFPNAVKVVDPVMGDHGKAYSSITPSFINAMRDLCKDADLILPNYTEAHLLLQLAYPNMQQTPPTPSTANALGKQLLALANSTVITGVPLDTQIGCAVQTPTADFWVQQPRLARSFPGTGDLYAAVLIGALLNGNTLHAAAEQAAVFVSKAIENTPADADTRFGVCFEPVLPLLFAQNNQ